MGIATMKAILANPPKPPKPVRYYPNRETIIVLKCGCLTSQWLHIHELGGKDYQYCDRHESWERIIRDSTIVDRVAFYFYGMAAPKRSNTRSLAQLLTMSGSIRNEAGRHGTSKFPLF